MEFKLTEDTLQRLEQKEEITVRGYHGICSYRYLSGSPEWLWRTDPPQTWE